MRNSKRRREELSYSRMFSGGGLQPNCNKVNENSRGQQPGIKGAISSGEVFGKYIRGSKIALIYPKSV